MTFNPYIALWDEIEVTEEDLMGPARTLGNHLPGKPQQRRLSLIRPRIPKYWMRKRTTAGHRELRVH